MTAKEAKCWLEMLSRMIEVSDGGNEDLNKKLVNALEIGCMAIDSNAEQIEIDGGIK